MIPIRPLNPLQKIQPRKFAPSIVPKTAEVKNMTKPSISATAPSNHDKSIEPPSPSPLSQIQSIIPSMALQNAEPTSVLAVPATKETHHLPNNTSVIVSAERDKITTTSPSIPIPAPNISATAAAAMKLSSPQATTIDRKRAIPIGTTIRTTTATTTSGPTISPTKVSETEQSSSSKAPSISVVASTAAVVSKTAGKGDEAPSVASSSLSAASSSASATSAPPAKKARGGGKSTNAKTSNDEVGPIAVVGINTAAARASSSDLDPVIAATAGKTGRGTGGGKKGRGGNQIAAATEPSTADAPPAKRQRKQQSQQQTTTVAVPPAATAGSSSKTTAKSVAKTVAATAATSTATTAKETIKTAAAALPRYARTTIKRKGTNVNVPASATAIAKAITTAGTRAVAISSNSNSSSSSSSSSSTPGAAAGILNPATTKKKKKKKRNAAATPLTRKQKKKKKKQTATTTSATGGGDCLSPTATTATGVVGISAKVLKKAEKRIQDRSQLLPSSFGAATQFNLYTVFLKKTPTGIGLKLKLVEGKLVVRGFVVKEEPPEDFTRQQDGVEAVRNLLFSMSNNSSSGGGLPSQLNRQSSASSSAAATAATGSPAKTGISLNPAYAAGVRLNDVIVAVNNFDAADCTKDQLLTALKWAPSYIHTQRLGGIGSSHFTPMPSVYPGVGTGVGGANAAGGSSSTTGFPTGTKGMAIAAIEDMACIKFARPLVSV